MKLKFKTKHPLQVEKIEQRMSLDGKLYYIIDNVIGFKIGDEIDA